MIGRLAALAAACLLAASCSSPPRQQAAPAAGADRRAKDRLGPQEYKVYLMVRGHLTESQREALVFRRTADKMIQYLLGSTDVLKSHPGMVDDMPYPFRNRLYVAMHPELDQQVRNAVWGAEPINGMTRAQIKACWGRPDRIGDVPAGPRGEIAAMSKAAWIYHRSEGKRYVIFDGERAQYVTSKEPDNLEGRTDRMDEMKDPTEPLPIE